MFFYEWVIPVLAVFVIAAVTFYLAVRNRANAGVRTDGEVLHDEYADRTADRDRSSGS
ncbi:MAG TPA: hypothetical protein VEH04_16650 [Verrucomicrobiae bacterium]|nr:hypothetical protein [Verrucomicrobiae bacterium]